MPSTTTPIVEHPIETTHLVPQKFPFGVHPAIAMIISTMDALPVKTGKSLEQWIAFIQKNGPPTEKEQREWLKAEHGLGTNQAWWLVERAMGRGLEETDSEAYLQAAEGYVRAMFAGGKEKLIPLYERLMECVLALGDDVKACPCKTVIPLYRKQVFAQIKPTTRTRIDLGLALKDRPASGKLVDTGGFAKKDRITHRIPISGLGDIEDETLGWLRAAYELNP